MQTSLLGSKKISYQSAKHVTLFISRPSAQYCPTPPAGAPVHDGSVFAPASFNGTVYLNKPGIYSGGRCLGQQGNYARANSHETIGTSPREAIQ